MNFSLTIFIPAYNEALNLPNSVNVLIKKAEELNITAEILIVNDCSQDQTATIAEQLAQSSKLVRVIHHKLNQGIGAAFVTAVKNAASEWLILIPADLALEADGLRQYLAAASKADIVVGLRSDRSDYTLARKFVSWVNIHLIQLLFGMEEHQFQYISMYRMETLREIEIEYWKSAFFLAEILIKTKALGKKLVEVEVKYIPRVTGTATGAKNKLVVLTIIDLFHFWLRWIWLGPKKASQRTRIT
jgi:glycosyltransferase involved in cell wall biosynthesis